ncbi:RNA polymerase sigma-70 factor, ECF subfamily [Flavobacteriaceae bacterium MAR_2010_188]|nr:RNA polymerase sigma-70 factor, ECF subfamily [Flavobacteriaceae bacterium MAR_2010_188]
MKNFDSLFKEHYTFLCLISYSILKDRDAAKDVVHDFFISYWQKKNNISIEISFRAYAVKAIKNLSIQAIRKSEKENSLLNKVVLQEYDIQRDTEVINFKQKIFRVLEKLPEKRREIFVAAVLNGHSYEEIAETRAISINTVKTQIKRSYAFLRTYRREDFVIIFICSISSLYLF